MELNMDREDELMMLVLKVRNNIREYRRESKK